MEGNWDTREYWVVVKEPRGTRTLHGIGYFRNIDDAWTYFNNEFPNVPMSAAILVHEEDVRQWFETLKERFA